MAQAFLFAVGKPFLFPFQTALLSVMKVGSCVLFAGVVAARRCDLDGQFADMHDGDQKLVKVQNGAAVITSNSGGTWEVDTTLDCHANTMMVDFDVPGKDDHPPVPLLATLWSTSSKLASKNVFEFTDPSGTLDTPTAPLNQWVDLAHTGPSRLSACPTSLDAIFADMHDGDQKRVTIDGTSLTIRPHGNDPPQTWEVKTTLNSNCQAVVDFKDSG